MLTESYNNKILELKNTIKEHLSQYSYLRYTLREVENELFITFTKDVTFNYVKNLLSGFSFDIISKSPIKLKMLSEKHVDTFKEFRNKIVIGTIEQVDIPDFDIEKLDVKIDSGATVSSMHVDYLKIDRLNKEVTFIPLDKRFKQYNKEQYTLPYIELVSVQNSSGDEEERPLIKTTIKIKDVVLDAYLTLCNRDKLVYPILIGKDIIGGRFLIDVSKI